MKMLNILPVFSATLLVLTTGAVNAAPPGFSAAIKNSLGQLEKSPYKALEVHTTSGSFSGEFVSQSKDVIVLKTKTGDFQMKLGKEKIRLTSIKVNSITAISVYVLDR
ncbi:hypothetical protein MNBD_GAMMA11-2512 [hydrothermal vent metagenome]|uniref:Uncharacterized protein n=1 Tax=hydrothermal vent metagenome TaxID=652676 RepID=A0A3B0XAR5_9ZZZZ